MVGNKQGKKLDVLKTAWKLFSLGFENALRQLFTSCVGKCLVARYIYFTGDSQGFSVATLTLEKVLGIARSGGNTGISH